VPPESNRWGTLLIAETENGGHILAVWQDKVTRRIIGWSLSNDDCRISYNSVEKKRFWKINWLGQLFIQTVAVNMRLAGLLLQTNCLRQSMSGVKHDNAQAESFSPVSAEPIEGGSLKMQEALLRGLQLYWRLLQPSQTAFGFRLQNAIGIWDGFENKKIVSRESFLTFFLTITFHYSFG